MPQLGPKEAKISEAAAQQFNELVHQKQVETIYGTTTIGVGLILAVLGSIAEINQGRFLFPAVAAMILMGAGAYVGIRLRSIKKQMRQLAAQTKHRISIPRR